MEQKTLATRLRTRLARSDLTMEQLVDEAHQLLTVLAPHQTRYKVRERPDVRTIRYYISQGLLPKPVSYDGGRARYSGGHLLKLLLIKKMQAEHHTLQQAGEVLATLDDLDVLEALLPGASTVSAAPGVLSPRPPVAGTRKIAAVRRIRLESGANLDIPEAQFQDPRQRQALADELAALARLLAGDRHPDVRDDEGDET